ncbi:MAG: DNA polymerase III subunit delta, partial [Gammaproteobacteria bacterium]|nr:DNA polymerase III subunit delta [Gammaproteobacteria bacterium]
ATGDDILLLSTAKVDRDMKKAKWFKAIETVGALVQVWPVKADDLPGWLVRRARDAGIRLEADAAAFIATRVEGNLLAAAQELEKLALVTGGERLDLKAAMGAVADSARYDVFSLVDQIAQGNATQALRMLRGLRGEGTPIAVVTWALARELRTLVTISEAQERGSALGPAMRAARVFDSREGLVRAMLKRHDGAALFEQLRAVARLDRLMKLGGTERIWSEAEWLVLAMTGAASHGRMMSLMAETPLQ